MAPGTLRHANSPRRSKKKMMYQRFETCFAEFGHKPAVRGRELKPRMAKAQQAGRQSVAPLID